MRLKSIELNGFKTFATKTNFEFADEITVIVGPNGSGKSNIADAVRWVLGEQSYKLLRGKKTLDMIFSGSEQRPRAGMAAASIVFDNSEGWLPIDFSEVSITRKAFRDGKNEYLINGQQVLLRDVYELLGQSGLAERTYTIIGQGLVDAALSLKAEERRSLFEEAAGIGLYRSRKADAERRLEKTHRNLDRVDDILSELKPRLKSLQRQAVRAEQYDQVKADLRILLQEWYGYHWARVQEDLQKAKQEEETRNNELIKARTTQESFDRKLSENQARVQSQRSSLNTWHRDLAEQHDQKETISRNRAVVEERIRSLKNQVQDLETEKIRLSEALSLAEERLERTSKEAQADRARLEEATGKAEEARKTLDAKQKQLTDLELEASKARDDLDRFSEQQIRLRSRLTDRADQIQRMNSRLGEAKAQVDQAKENLKKIDSEFQKTKAEYDKGTATREKLELAIIKIQEEQRSGDKYRQDLLDQLSNLKTENSRLAAELNVLQQADQQLAGYADGAKLLLQQTQSGKITGTLGTLNNFIDVPEEYEKPIAAALGGYLDAVILESEADTEKALELLLHESIKGVLLPLNQLIVLDRPSIPSNVSGFIGIAADLIKTTPKIRPVIDLLLGRVFIMKDKKDVKRVLRDQPLGTKAVTLQGEVFHATGEVVAGFEGQPSILSRSRQKKTWQDKIEKSLQKITDLEEDIKRVDQKLADHTKKEVELNGDLAIAKQAQTKIDIRYKQTSLDNNLAEKQVEWETARYQSIVDDIAAGEEEIKTTNQELEEIKIGIASSQEVVQKTSGLLRGISLEEERAQLAHWETQAAVADRALHDIEQRLREREAAWKEAQSLVEMNTQSLQDCQNQIKELTSESQSLQDDEENLQLTIIELRKLVDETESKLTKDEDEQRELQRLEAKARQVLNQAERTYAQADINLTRNKEKLDNIQERIREDIGLVELEYNKDISGPTPLPFDGYVQKLPVVKDISSDLGNTIREQRAQLRRLGAINPEAQNEYREVNDRHNFLTEQLDDLKQAEADLREVITELDVLMEREFRKTFNAVAGEFKEIFTQLFGGGKGQLILSEPDDLTGSGVDIQVRLPGRRTQGLSLLSGGERSLIAAALIFALLKISPTPFCVLDEVDAMLDEANVARYRKLLRELSSDTQFIVITHNRNTVEVADIIYGIIMAEDSTSQVLSLKLDEVDEVIES
jgi:chromosome segregation protein